MRYISAPQRSQITLSSAGAVVLSGVNGRTGGAGGVSSGMGRLSHTRSGGPRAAPCDNSRVNEESLAVRIVRRTREIAVMAAKAAGMGAVQFYRGDSPAYAASIAYYSLLSLFPFFMIALSIIGGVAADAQDRAAVLRFLQSYFPAQFDFLTAQLDAFRTNSIPLGIVGIVALVWGAIGVFSAITTAVNYAWGVEKRRSFLKHKGFAFIMMVVAAGLLTLSALLVSASHVVGASWFTRVLAEFPGLGILRSLTVRFATTGLLILVVGLIFYYVPNVKVPFRDVWIGAFVTGLLWRGALEIVSWYARDLSELTRINGSITAVVVFLVWVYVQAMILLYGAELTAAYARLRGDRLEPEPED
jgi:membrane protein